MSDLSAKITITAVDHASATVARIGASLNALKASAKGITAAWGGVSSAAGNLARNLAVLTGVTIGAGAAVWGLTKHYADAAEQLSLSAQKAGVSAESLQRLQYSAKLANVETTKLDMGLKFLNKNMAGSLLVTGGGKKGKGGATQNLQAQAFKELGISVKNANGTMKTADQTILEISDKFKTMTNAAEKVRIAQTLMGRQGTDLIPILNQGSDALKKQGDELAKIGHILTSKEIEEGKHFAEDLKRLNVAVSGLGAVIAGALIPVITPLIEQMTNWIAANKEWLSTQIVSDVQAFGTALYSVWQTLGAIKAVIWPVIAALGGIKTVIYALSAAYLASTIVRFVQLAMAIKTLVVALIAAIAPAWAFASAILAAAAPVLFVVAAIALIGYALYELISRFQEFKAAWFQVWGLIPQPVKDALRMALGVVTFGMSEIVMAVYNNWGKIGNAFKTGIQSALAGAANLFQTFISSVVSFFSPLINALNMVVNGIIKIKNAISGGVNGTVNIKTNVPAGLSVGGQPYTGTAPATNAGRYSMLNPPNQKLDVYMKIDAQGKPSQVSAKTDSNTTFHANTGAMV